MRAFVIILCSIIIFGCAASRKHSEKYTGSSIDEVIDRLGPPDVKHHSDSGAWTYRWVLKHQDAEPNLGAYSLDYRYKCKVTAKTGPDKIITDFKTHSTDNHPYIDACDKLMNNQ